MRRIAFVGLLAAALAAPLAQAEKKKPGLFDFESWKTPVAREREAAQHLAPAPLDLTPAPGAGGETHAVRLRVYADEGHRSGVVRWQARLRAQIDRLNRVLLPIFNVQLEIESLREWRRGGGGDLGTVLRDLEKTDSGQDVDWVVGLTTPFRGVAADIHQIGQAALLSRHMVLRGMDDEQEGRVLEQELSLLGGAERQRVYEERRTHKEAVVFLHEWAHTMGVVHSDDRDRIMNPVYDSQVSRFSDVEKEIMALVLDRRLRHRGELYPESSDLLPLLQSRPKGETPATELGPVLEMLRARSAAPAQAAARPAAGADGGAAPLVVAAPPAVIAAFNRAIAEANAGRPLEAWRLLAPLLADAQKPDSGALDAAAWVALARLASGVGALTAAEGALAHAGKAPDAAALTGEIETRRRHLFLPRDPAAGGVAPDQEPAYVMAFTAAAAAIPDRDPKTARARLATLTGAYPGAAGIEALACELDLRAGRVASADRHCQTALARFDEAPRAHLLAGVIADLLNRPTVAEKQLRQAIDLDPSEPGGWRELVRHYRAHRAGVRAEAVQAQYQALFSKPLPE